jgi:probable H4MPT-linked C1 transfer pathway protein
MLCRNGDKDGMLTGWDLGGAHLKVAQARDDGMPILAAQVPCTLWRGLDHLGVAFAALRPRLQPSRRHGLTMTGELADLFADRGEGVARLVAAAAAALPEADPVFYAGARGFLPPPEAASDPVSVASANWHATAAFVGRRCGDALLLDIGSTTTDIVPVAGGIPVPLGSDDAGRMAADELVYTGVVRTPVMALARDVPFAGARRSLMNELFATAADVHRLTGRLDEAMDQHDTADRRDKTIEASAARLARMLGCDAADAPPDAWHALAACLAECQIRQIHDAACRVLSRGTVPAAAPVVAAGAGLFLAGEIARRLGRQYRDFATIAGITEPELARWVSCCAPAVAVAGLLADGYVRPT